MATPTYNETVLADDPVAFWPLDDSGADSTARDLGPNGYTLGPAYPDPEPGVPGPFDAFYVLLDRRAWTATASVAPEDVALAFDGDLTNGWNNGHAQVPGETFTLDLGVVQDVIQLQLDNTTNTSDYPRGYTLALSTNGTTWVDVASGVGATPITTITFTQQSARYLRVTQTGSDDFWSWTINELRVYRYVPNYAVRFRWGGVISGPETSLPTNGTLTLEAWVKDDTPSSALPGGYAFVFGYGDGGLQEGFVSLMSYVLGYTIDGVFTPTGLETVWGWASADDPYHLFRVDGSGGSLVAPGGWHHLLVTLTDTIGNVYMDGVGMSGNPVDFSFLPLSAAPAQGTFWIGGGPQSTRATWGDLAYCAVYDYILSDARIAAHAACTDAAVYTGAVLSDCPLALWPLQEH